MQKNLLRTLVLGAAAVSLAACGNLSKVKSDGTTDNPVFPKSSDALFSSSGKYPGSWVQKEDVALITAGMTKDQVYSLLGRPHFSEGLFDVREWDYVLNYKENGEHKVCQYKVLFDTDMHVTQQYWKPADCSLASNVAATPVVAPVASAPEHKHAHPMKKVHKKKKVSKAQKAPVKKSAPSKALEVITPTAGKKA